MDKPVLYGMEISSVVRSVLMTAKALNIDIEYKEIDLFSGDQMKPDYLKMNPLHTVPTLADNGQYLWESHAIIPYLAEKYGKDDSLYPKNDIYKRARINMFLHFDNGTLYGGRLRDVVLPIYSENQSTITEKVVDSVQQTYGIMERFLENDSYLVGSSMTLADLSCVTNISSLIELVPADPAKYPKMHAWLKRLQALPYYQEANGKGNVAYIAMLRGLMAKGKQ